MSQNLWRKRKMATADAIRDEVRGYLKMAAGRDHKTVERAIERAADALGIDFSRAWGIWYGKVNRLWADEVDTIRARAREVKAKAIAHARAELERLEAEDAALTRELGALGSANMGARQETASSPDRLDVGQVAPRAAERRRA